MSKRRALIVDDSKTAQVRLRKMLARYDLEVDIAFSAEEALGFLSYKHADVIFMDHHMEGMDGFEALRIIKANPSTATVPVIMYTAQKGDVYVGQARALGAMDILSKEFIKASNIERVLNGLNIYQKGAEVVEETPSTREVLEETDKKEIPPPPVDLNHVDSALDQVRSQIARLFEIHIADVRNQISENTRFVVRRLSGEIEKGTKREVTVDDVPISVVGAELSAERSRTSIVSNSLLLLIFIGLGILAFGLFDTRNDIKSVAEKHQILADMAKQENELLSDFAENAFRSKQETKEVEASPLYLKVLSWALEGDLSFGYSEPPLGESQVTKIHELVQGLSSASFKGVVTLDIHFGNVCLVAASTGQWIVADDDIEFSQCTFLENVSSGFSPSDYLSVQYINLEQSAEPFQSGDIELEVVTSGLDFPLHPYPSTNRAVKVSEWNEAALKNNRISVRFEPF